MLKFSKDLFMIIMGSLLYALAINLLIIPNNFADGGLAGASIILHYVFDWSPGLINFILSSIIILIGYRALPKRITLLTLITAPLISLLIILTESNINPLADPLVSAIFAGVLSGIGTGLIFRTGSSMGGTSIIARMFNHNWGWELTRTNLVLDTIIVFSGYLVIGPLNTLYTVISLFIGKKATDIIIDGLDSRKAVSVISHDAPEIIEEVTEQLQISATVFEGYGLYLREPTDMAYMIIHKYQLFKLKKIINSIDDNALVVVHDVRDVFGGSFKWTS